MPTPTLTRVLVGLHGAGRADTYGAALLDVAQDHLLWLLAELGHFDDGALLFKGGTSLRKVRLGSAGRFSTDLDFVAPSEDTVLEVCERASTARPLPASSSASIRREVMVATGVSTSGTPISANPMS
jgi:predicted nucleotidyltransferase component of viral defense system